MQHQKRVGQCRHVSRTNQDMFLQDQRLIPCPQDQTCTTCTSCVIQQPETTYGYNMTCTHSNHTFSA
jgi:hypothetical protein